MFDTRLSTILFLRALLLFAFFGSFRRSHYVGSFLLSALERPISSCDNFSDVSVFFGRCDVILRSHRFSWWFDFVRSDQFRSSMFRFILGCPALRSMIGVHLLVSLDPVRFVLSLCEVCMMDDPFILSVN